jgi:type II secretory pathway component PulK
MRRLRAVLEEAPAGKDVWYVLRVIRYQIKYLAVNCKDTTDDLEEAWATDDREQAFALAKVSNGLVLRWEGARHVQGLL